MGDPMTPAEAALLAAVLAAPGDDAPRLVYADWLEEHAVYGPCERCRGGTKVNPKDGFHYDRTQNRFDFDPKAKCSACSGAGSVSDGRKERAEFIRVQCELATQGVPGRQPQASPENDRRQDLLQAREQELLEDHGNRWARELANLVNFMAPITGNELHWMGQVILSWEWSRGFIDTVRLPLGAFLGGECGWCNGQGHNVRVGWDTTRYEQCNRCSGTGQTPGLAADLFAAWPITSVEASDREPLEDSYGHWFWFKDSPGPSGRDDLPPEVFTALGGYLEHRLENDDGLESKSYPTRDLARSAASAALVARGRHLAGLPPL